MVDVRSAGIPRIDRDTNTSPHHRWTLPEVFLVVVVAVYKRYTRPYPSRASPQRGRSRRRSQDVAVQSAERQRAPVHTPVWPRREAHRLDYSPHPARPRQRPFSRGGPVYRASRGRSTPSSIVIGQQVPGGVHTPYRVATSRNRYAVYTFVRERRTVTNARARVGTCVVKTCVVKNSTHATWSPRTR